MTRIATRLSILALLLAPLTGCNAYVLKGKVIQGDISFVAVVPASDPRLEEAAGVPNASIRLETDPTRINREIVGETVTDSNGNFQIPFRKVGGKLLMYDVGITGRKTGFTPAMLNFRLPPSDQRVLIILKTGPDGYRDPYEDSLNNQVDRFKGGD